MSTTAELAARAGLPRIKPGKDESCSEAAMGTLQYQAATWLADVRAYGAPPLCWNAAIYPPPSLDKFRTAALRAPADAAPVLWYWQMTGETWDRKTHSYKVCSAGASHSARRLLTRWLDPHLTAGEEGALADAARGNSQGAHARGRPEEARPRGGQ